MISYWHFLGMWERRLTKHSDVQACRIRYRRSFASCEERLKEDLPPEFFARLSEVAKTRDPAEYSKLGAEITEFLDA